MKRVEPNMERILKGVAIGLLCLFLCLGGFLLVKLGQNRDSMEHNVPAEDAYTLPLEETEEEPPKKPSSSKPNNKPSKHMIWSLAPIVVITCTSPTAAT